jgi:hypothetical protein
MICFRDMTFCANSHECGTETCARHWNEHLQRQAEMWMKNPPVAWAHFKPSCHIFTEKKHEAHSS